MFDETRTGYSSQTLKASCWEEECKWCCNTSCPGSPTSTSKHAFFSESVHSKYQTVNVLSTSQKTSFLSCFSILEQLYQYIDIYLQYFTDRIMCQYFGSCFYKEVTQMSFYTANRILICLAGLKILGLPADKIKGISLFFGNRRVIIFLTTNNTIIQIYWL